MPGEKAAAETVFVWEGSHCRIFEEEAIRDTKEIERQTQQIGRILTEIAKNQLANTDKM